MPEAVLFDYERKVFFKNHDYSSPDPHVSRGVQNLTYYPSLRKVVWSNPLEGTVNPYQYIAEIHDRLGPDLHPNGYNGTSRKTTITVNLTGGGIVTGPPSYEVIIPPGYGFPNSDSETLRIISFFGDGSSSFTIIEDILKTNEELQFLITATKKKLRNLRGELNRLINNPNR